MKECEPTIYECQLCGTQFEADVADRDPVHGPRCPQCLMASAREITPEEVGAFVVRSGTPFR